MSSSIPETPQTQPHDDTASSSSFVVNTAAMICHAPLIAKLVAARLPPNYVGARQTMTAVATNTRPATVQATSSSIVFKVQNSDGTERRMTKQEKKAAKAAQRKRKRMEQQEEKEKGPPTPVAKQEEEEEQKQQQITEQEQDSSAPLPKDNSDSKYHQLSVKNAVQQWEEEERMTLEEHGDGRGGRPPVLLSPPMAWVASQIPDLMMSKNVSAPDTIDHFPSSWKIQYDETLSQQWAQQIKESMKPAESIRVGETGLRPMAYQLVPEVWTRMRPTAVTIPFPTHLHSKRVVKPTTSATDWIPVTCRPTNRFDLHAAVVLEYLHFRQQGEQLLHISCGAKFGSDFLVYDGPRHERHAFAGLRILMSKTGDDDATTVIATTPLTSPPLPSAYGLAGFVRGLNTAGKLALLATVLEDHENRIYRVAFVDLALEKILTAPTHQKYGRQEKRRDVAKNLAKNSKT